MHDELRVRPLRADEFGAWSHHVTEEYARDISENGDTPPDIARRKADDDMARILPEGLATPDHWIYRLVLGDTDVGTLWLAKRDEGRPTMFIYDIEVDAPHRGRGLGRAGMLLAEREALAMGIRRIELNVFGGNTVARNLYRSLGYVERAVLMGKDLASAAPPAQPEGSPLEPDAQPPA